MTTFSLKSSAVTFDGYLQEMSEALGVPLINGLLELPAAVGDGYFRVSTLPNGLMTMQINYTLHANTMFERPSTDAEIYSLRFEDIEVVNKFVTQIGDEYRENEVQHLRSAYLMCTLFDMGFFGTKGSHIRSIMIQFDRPWLARYLQMDTYDHILQQYLALKTNAIDVEFLDADYMRSMEEIENIKPDHPAHITMINNRIMHMVERFFIRLYEKRHQLSLNIKAGDDDIAAARKTERLITTDFSKPFPSIDELAAQAGMSSSKLKKLFREIYKKPIYQYYQSARMQKARTMLLGGGNSVKSVGISLGFSNLSNFSVAFKKEFNMLPGELVNR